jgi:hypothetical protein
MTVNELYSDRSYLVGNLKAKVEPYLLEDPDVKNSLDKLFKNCPVISPEEATKLGFINIKLVGCGTARTVRVMEHENLKGYLVKIPRLKDADPSKGLDRVKAHREGSRITLEEEMNIVHVSENYLYPIPNGDEGEIERYNEFQKNKAHLKATLNKREYDKAKEAAEKIFATRFLVVEKKLECIPLTVSRNTPHLSELTHEYPRFVLLMGETDGHGGNVLQSKDKKAVYFVDLEKWRKNPQERERRGMLGIRMAKLTFTQVANQWLEGVQNATASLEFESSRTLKDEVIKDIGDSVKNEPDVDPLIPKEVDQPLIPKKNVSWLSYLKSQLGFQTNEKC